MKPVRTFDVIPALPSAVEGLRAAACNLHWTWDHETIELFRRLDRDLWESTGHNPVLMLGVIEQEKLEAAARDDAFLGHLERVSGGLDSYLEGNLTWFGKRQQPADSKLLTAYFSAEFGITECLSIFAGGLGILAGDHLKSSSDLGVPLVGVGLLYQQGYFRQYTNQAGWQQESYEANDFTNLPVSPVLDVVGRPLTVGVELTGREVRAQVWVAQVGRVPLYLLDTNIAANPNAEDRVITDQLYGGDRETRIRQEIVLGIGGYRALRAVGLEPTVYHMNEGHSAFLALERIRQLMEGRSLSFAEARELASASLVFTTHTPVEAGHDYFSPDLMDRYFGAFAGRLGLSSREFMALGRKHPDDGSDFCMTVLALRLASYSNGVSKLHGEVSRRMWQVLWPAVPTDEVPVRHITNGVHFRSWISLEMNQLYDRYLGPKWHEEPADQKTWNRIYSVSPEELWRSHERRRDRLVAWVRGRVRAQWVKRGAPPSEIAAAQEVLNPNALTIGFARRFATYKRGTLILRDLPRLERLLMDAERPVQIIFSGKAHPRDDAGKELIRQINGLTRQPTLGRHMVFIADYDMSVARYLVQGVDVWLNTPRRPLEASGTSGMKAAANGALNLSTLDGWWDEVWREREVSSDGVRARRASDSAATIGWAIGKGESYNDPDYQDQVEAEALYDLLEHDVIPTFYDRGEDRIPRRWVDRMKASIATVCPLVSTNRMVKDYTEQFYLKAHERYRVLEAEGTARAKLLAAWVARVRSAWPEVRVETVEQRSNGALPVGTSLHARASVRLGPLAPDDVRVELFIGRVSPSGDLSDHAAIRMQPAGDAGEHAFWFEANAPCERSGKYGFTIRVRPDHADLTVPFVPGLIRWAEQR
ncbi:MAG TPA: alpha-glucan family phosphorylase [Terriglobia bacterium]|nr:alpha-glucan family phosphorylase [Terriglobia bacterium]